MADMVRVVHIENYRKGNIAIHKILMKDLFLLPVNKSCLLFSIHTISVTVLGAI